MIRMAGILAELAVGANPTVCSEIRNHASQLRTQIEAQKDSISNGNLGSI